VRLRALPSRCCRPPEGSRRSGIKTPDAAAAGTAAAPTTRQHPSRRPGPAELIDALFLNQPAADDLPDPGHVVFNPTLVYQLKQNLWHRGVLATKAQPGAAKGAKGYRPDTDARTLDARLLHRAAR